MCATAAIQFQQVNPDELKMASEPLAPGAQAIILYREVNRDDFGGHSHGGMQVSMFNSIERKEDDYRRIKILTEEGRKYADVEIPMMAGYQNIVNIAARTIRPDGSTVNFDGKVFDKTVYKRKGLKYRAKAFTLSDVQVGSIIEYSYTVMFEGGFLWNSDWDVSDELFQKRAKFSLKPFQAQNAQLSLRWVQHLAPGMPEPHEDGDGVVRLEVQNVPAFQTEDYMPLEKEYRSRVAFIYGFDAVETDANRFWQKVYKRRSNELESFISKRGAVEQAVAQTTASGDSPEVKARKLYARALQLRNTTYEVQKTEEQKKRENEKQVSSADDVLNFGYGTESQLNWLYLAMLRAARLEAYGMALSSRRESSFDPQAMNARDLDGTAVVAKLDGKDVYLNPGARFVPFGFLKWDQTGVRGLRLGKDGGNWIQTPVPDASASQIQRNAVFKLSDEGDLVGEVTVSYTGLEGFKRRAEEGNNDDVAKKAFLEDELRRYIATASEVTLSNSPDWADSSSPLTAKFNVKISGWILRGGKMAFMPLGIFGASEKQLFIRATRTYPIYFDYPYEQLDDISIGLPAGWEINSLPQTRKEEYPILAYGFNAENRDGRLHLTRKLDINTVSLEVRYYRALQAFFQGVRSGDEEKVSLKVGTTVGSR